MEQNFQEKLPEIRKAVEFPKCEPFNQKTLEIRRAKLIGKKTSA